MNQVDQINYAARVGNEAAVRQLLAAGARADQPDGYGWLPLHSASRYGHEGVVRLLLEAAPDAAMAADTGGFTPLHHAAGASSSGAGNYEIVQLLLEAAPTAALMLNMIKEAPIHIAALRNNTAPMQLLLEAAPEVAYAQDAAGRTPLQWALSYCFERPSEQVMETARCLLRAAPAMQPALGILLQHGRRSATLFANLVAHLPLSQEQWRSIPAPCPDLARALPAVLQRSAAEAGWLVGRLYQYQRKRLRAAALSLARAQQQNSAVLPAELSGRILALSAGRLAPLQ